MTLSRRDFLAAAGAAVPLLSVRLPVGAPLGAGARLAVITDLHHGLAPDALERFDAFLDAIPQHPDLDAVWQLGDFCYSDAGSDALLAKWRRIALPRHSVLGNHDMDKVDKAAAMAAWGMATRYHASVIGGWRFVALDLNNFRKDGKVLPYANGNYFNAGSELNRADPEQLAWLDRQLRTSREPVILIGHQPLGIGGADNALPDEQREIFDLIRAAGRVNPRGRVACCLSGHLHVDRLERVDGIPCLTINSASYFWSGGMHPYTTPLFAFLDFGADGILRITGRDGSFVNAPPANSDGVVGRSAGISSRRLVLR